MVTCENMAAPVLWLDRVERENVSAWETEEEKEESFDEEFGRGGLRAKSSARVSSRAFQSPLSFLSFLSLPFPSPLPFLFLLTFFIPGYPGSRVPGWKYVPGRILAGYSSRVVLGTREYDTRCPPLAASGISR